ncbi:MAG: hypothetical protein ILM98_06490 [Kiritimatiellae bacterium]|nr:hypothetical protein [Kiritimatiellia bacterium]
MTLTSKTKSIKRMIAISITCLIVLVCFFIFAPTEVLHSKNPRFFEQRLVADLSIPRDSIEYFAGRFRRESIIIFRLIGDSIPNEIFIRPNSDQQRNDWVKHIMEAAMACGVRITPSAGDELKVFYGNDYSVLYLSANKMSYLFYFGAQ